VPVFLNLRKIDERRQPMMTPLRVLVLVTGAMLTTTVFVAAQTPPEGQSAAPAYRPGLGDLMTTTVQPRHIKLALAGREKNWVYAAYELHQLDEAFDRLSIMWPQSRQVRIVEMIETIIRQPMFDLGQAIEEKNEAKFATSMGN
jgi:hypothetical protein